MSLSKEAWSPRSDLERVAENDPSLTEVYWSSKGIGDEEVIKLAKALRDNTHVTELWLNGNRITDVGAKALAEMLQLNTTITHLGLINNKISDAGAKALAEMLRVNGTVTTLSLYGNKITDAGAKALAEMLRVNSTITGLGLRGNKITEAGAKALAEVLRVNVTVTFLDFDINEISLDLDGPWVHRLLKINQKASTPHEAFGQKVKLAVDSEHGSSEDVMTLAQAGLERFPESKHFKDLASYVDLETGRNLYGLAAERGAGAALVSLLRAHPSLCAHKEEDEQGGLYPFMRIATVPTVGVGDVFEVLLLKPDLVACGIKTL